MLRKESVEMNFDKIRKIEDEKIELNNAINELELVYDALKINADKFYNLPDHQKIKSEMKTDLINKIKEKFTKEGFEIEERPNSFIYSYNEFKSFLEINDDFTFVFGTKDSSNIFIEFKIDQLMAQQYTWKNDVRRLPDFKIDRTPLTSIEIVRGHREKVVKDLETYMYKIEKSSEATFVYQVYDFRHDIAKGHFLKSEEFIAFLLK
jgi:hypothetical protein